MEKKFKCKDEVIFQSGLYLGDVKPIWNYGIVNYEDEGYVHLVGGLCVNKKKFEIFPYEGNEHLVGTTNEPDEEVRLEEGEWVMCSIVGSSSTPFDYEFGKFINIENEHNYIRIQHYNEIRHAYLFIRFKDFDPSNMEETKKHILCVKNGKIVKYKG